MTPEQSSHPNDVISSLDLARFSPWCQSQIIEIVDYCQKRSWRVCHISELQSRQLQPVLSVWQISYQDMQNTKTAWFINGDLPIGHIPYQQASSAREALLGFSRKYLFIAQKLRKQQPMENRQQSQRVSVKQKTVSNISGKKNTDEVVKSNLPEQQSHNTSHYLQSLVKAEADLLVLYHDDGIWQ